MRYDRVMRFAVPLIAASAVLFPYSAAGAPQDAQASQDRSVADAARQARAARKNAAKTAKVISDDDIDTKSVKPGAEGLNVGAAPKSEAQPPSAAAVSAVEASDAKAAAAESGAPGKAGEDPEIAKAKAELAEAAKQLDLLQRGFALDSDSYYSKPDFSNDKDGKAKLDAEQQQISDKQQEVDRLKAHLEELKASRKKAAPAGAAETSESDKPAETPSAANPPQS
jgi:hypothetical protein